jgi:hypothetical protein
MPFAPAADRTFLILSTVLNKGTRQIGVILYAKGDLHGAAVPADELPIEDILTVKHPVPAGRDRFHWRPRRTD